MQDMPPLPTFPIGDKVDVVGGTFAGDHGYVMKSGLDPASAFLLVNLARARMIRYVAVDCLRPRQA
jgi:hypothetical protein